MGLLADLYAPSLPWRLVVDDGVAWDIGDTFLNSVKEVSEAILLFVRFLSISGCFVHFYSCTVYNQPSFINETLLTPQIRPTSFATATPTKS